jgi:hypothetical protein
MNRVAADFVRLVSELAGSCGTLLLWHDGREASVHRQPSC